MRYLLDTNVVSEARTTGGDPGVRDFLRNKSDQDLFVSAITIGEIRSGIVRLPNGKRRRELESWFVQFRGEYRFRIVDVDAEVASIWGELFARDRNRSVPDGLIAASALSRNLTVVTRNVKDFDWTGVPIINPWLDEDDA